jgi:hypothetical protein
MLLVRFFGNFGEWMLKHIGEVESATYRHSAVD